MVSRRAFCAVSGLAAVGSVLPASAKEDSEVIKAIALRFVDEVLTAGNTSALPELVSPNYESANDEDAPGLDAYQTRLDNYIQFRSYLITSIAFAVEASAVKSPNVFVRGHVTGADTQGKKVDALFFIQFEFQGGLITKVWSLVDDYTIDGF